MNRELSREELAGSGNGVVTHNGLLSFAAGLASQDRADVLNSVLYMQQEADLRVDMRVDLERWFRYYIGGLLDIGWDVDLEFASTPQLAPRLYDSVREAIGERIAVVRHDGVRQQTLAAFDALRYDDAIYSWFKKHVVSANEASFQISPCIYAGDRVYMFTLGVGLRITSNFKEFLFPVPSISGRAIVLDLASSALRLSKFRYAEHREAVKSQLGTRALAAVKNYRF